MSERNAIFSSAATEGSDDDPENPVSKHPQAHASAIRNILRGLQGLHPAIRPHQLFQLAKRIIRSIPATEDILQELNLKLVEMSPARLNRIRSQGYFVRATRNLSFDWLAAHRSKRVTRLEVADQERTDDSEHNEMHHIDLGLTPYFLSRLPEIQRGVYILCYHEGCTVAEAAARLGISTEAAKKRRQRALATIHETWREMSESQRRAALESDTSPPDSSTPGKEDPDEPL